MISQFNFNGLLKLKNGKINKMAIIYNVTTLKLYLLYIMLWKKLVYTINQMAIYILLFKPWYKCRWQLLPYFLILVMAIFSLNLGNVVHYKTCPENKHYKWNVFCNILHTKAITNYQLAISHIMLIKNFFCISCHIYSPFLCDRNK